MIQLASSDEDAGAPCSYARCLDTRAKHGSSNVTLSYAEPILMVRAAGTKMYDELDREWLDCVNNVAHVGHCSPTVVEAQCKQLQSLNTNARYLSTMHAQYTDALLATLPPQLDRCLLCNSGSEANDLALQIALAARPGAQHIAVLEGAYHGHVATMMQCSPYKFWGPHGNGRPAHVHVLPLPDSYRRVHLDAGAAARAAIAEATAAGGKIAAFFCESAPSCAGQLLLPPGYLAAAYAEMRAHGAVCIADEVQTGFGRFGNAFWAFETQHMAWAPYVPNLSAAWSSTGGSRPKNTHHPASTIADRSAQGVVPDMVTLGKAMGNGYPVSGLITNSAVAAGFAAGPKYFNTFGGNNVACASALAVLHAISQQGLQQRAADVGARLIAGLAHLRSEFPDTVGDVRGQGLFIGMEIVQSQQCRAHAPGKAAWLQEDLKRQKVLMSVDGRFENVLKIKPPLVFSTADADRLVACLREALRRMSAAADEVAALHKRKMANLEPGQALAQAYFARLLPEL